MIRAILFDFDGVLVNSELLHYQAFARAGRDAGITLSEEEYFRDLLGHDDRGVWRKIAEARGMTLDGRTLLALLAYKAQVVRELIAERRYSAVAGVEPLVRGLWRHYPLGICSGALREEIEAMLDGIGLRDCFRAITAAEDVDRGKPDPEGYLKTLAELGRQTRRSLKPSQALVFEDAPRVIASVRAAGFRTVGVPTSFGRAELGAEFYTKSMQAQHVLEAVPGLKVFEE